MKYMTNMGQNTGMLKNSKNVHVMATKTALVAPYLQGENTTNKFVNDKKPPYFTIVFKNRPELAKISLNGLAKDSSASSRNSRVKFQQLKVCVFSVALLLKTANAYIKAQGSDKITLMKCLTI